MKVNYTMGAIASFIKEYEYGYFGWPSVAKLEDGTLVAGASGFRRHHLCVDGKVVLYYGNKDGSKWQGPRFIEDSQIDDRDTGVMCLGGKEILVSWFTGNHFNMRWDNDQKAVDAVSYWSEAKFNHYYGSYIKVSKNDGKEFSEKIKVEVTAPHGPVLLKNGAIIYVGNTFNHKEGQREVKMIKSDDVGSSWYDVGIIPYSDDEFIKKGYCEPHVIEIEENHLLAVIRDQSEYKDIGKVFRVVYSHSYDNGKSWSKPLDLGVSGSPPHLMKHSSGALICSYGYREHHDKKSKGTGSGQRAVISYDNGKSWSNPYLISDHIDDGDLGYPCTVELDDHTLFTVYYQRESKNHHPGLLYSKWTLPEK